MTTKTKPISIVFPLAATTYLPLQQNGSLEDRTRSSASRSLSCLSYSPSDSSFSTFAKEWSPTSNPVQADAYRHFRPPSKPPSEILPVKEFLASASHLVSSLAALGDKLFSGSHDNLVKTWDLASGACMRTFEEHEDSVFALAADEKNLYSGSEDKTIIVRDALTGAYKTTLNGHDDGIRALLVSERTLFSSSYDGTIRAWDLDTYQCTRIFRNDASETAESGEELTSSFNAQGDDIFFYSLAVKDEVLYSGSNIGTIVLWNLKTGEAIRTLYGPIEPILSLLILGNRLFSTYSDSTIKIWDLTTCRVESSLRDDSGLIHCLASDGTFLYSGGSNAFITAWDLKSETPAAILRGHRDTIHSLQIAAGQLFSSSADGTIKSWPLIQNVQQ